MKNQGTPAVGTAGVSRLLEACLWGRRLVGGDTFGTVVLAFGATAAACHVYEVRQGQAGPNSLIILQTSDELGRGQ
jgi:hypothetical protein